MSKYRKLIVAGVGFIAILLSDVFGIDVLLGVQDQVIEVIIMVATFAGIERVPNEQV